MAIIVSVNKKVFAKGLAAAKSFRGVYDGATQTWRLNEELVLAAKGGDKLNTLVEWLGYRGLKLVEGDVPTAPARHDHNCAANFGGACECK